MQTKHTSAIAITFLLLVGACSIATSVHAGVRPIGDSLPVVNINTATAQQLAYLPGVGPSIAGRIVELRVKLGGRFDSIGRLVDVKGIGEVKYGKMRPYVAVDGQTTATGKIKIKAAKVEKAEKTTKGGVK